MWLACDGVVPDVVLHTVSFFVCPAAVVVPAVECLCLQDVWPGSLVWLACGVVPDVVLHTVSFFVCPAAVVVPTVERLCLLCGWLGYLVFLPLFCHLVLFSFALSCLLLSSVSVVLLLWCQERSTSCAVPCEVWLLCVVTCVAASGVCLATVLALGRSSLCSVSVRVPGVTFCVSQLLSSSSSSSTVPSSVSGVHHFG